MNSLDRNNVRMAHRVHPSLVMHAQECQPHSRRWWRYCTHLSPSGKDEKGKWKILFWIIYFEKRGKYIHKKKERKKQSSQTNNSTLQSHSLLEQRQLLLRSDDCSWLRMMSGIKAKTIVTDSEDWDDSNGNWRREDRPLTACKPQHKMMIVNNSRNENEVRITQ